MKRLIAALIIVLSPAAVSGTETAVDDDLQALPVVLKRETTITAGKIRLGDLFSGLDAEKGARVVAPAPAPGQEAILPARWLEQAAKKHGIDWSPADAKTAATVKRAADEIAKADVVARLARELKARGLPENAELSVHSNAFPLLVPAKSAWRFETVFAEYDERRKTFSATLRLIAGDDAPRDLDFTGKATYTLEIPTAKRDLKAGLILTRDDIVLKTVSADSARRRSDPAKIDDLIGKEIKRGVRAGNAIDAGDVQTQVMVAKGKTVTLTFAKGGIMLSTKGKALENGGLGDAVRVMNAQSKNVVEGTVTAPETVFVEPNNVKF